jgi:fructose-specific phosphotransferase system IIB component
MKIVAVTACPTGIAHTYMAAEQLEKAARKLGHQIRIEVQAAAGTENPLTQVEVDHADAVVIASDVTIENEERFLRASNIARVPMHIALKDAAAILAKFERPVLHGA